MASANNNVPKKSVRDRAHLALKTESKIAEEAAEAARLGVDLTASACRYTNGMLPRCNLSKQFRGWEDDFHLFQLE